MAIYVWPASILSLRSLERDLMVLMRRFVAVSLQLVAAVSVCITIVTNSMFCSDILQIDSHIADYLSGCHAHTTYNLLSYYSCIGDNKNSVLVFTFSDIEYFVISSFGILMPSGGRSSCG